ncbi:hypothetical protein [Clostridium acidisoli]|nr:hypothetical protein [Clostridium acidisoli]
MKELTRLEPSKVREVTYVTSKENLYILVYKYNSTICFNRRFCF